MFLLIIFVFITLNITAIILYKKHGINRIERLFVVQAISIGIIYGLILPPFTVSDEQVHFMNGYHIANIIQGISDEKTDKVQGLFDVYNLKIRDIDKRLFVEEEVLFDYSTNIVRQMSLGISPVIEKESKYIVKEQIITRYFPFPEYIIIGISIVIGRIVNLSPLALVWFARIVNMLVYTMICATAIKIIPLAKSLFYLVMLLPVGMYNICSTSYHTILYAETFFLFAFILYLKYKNGIVLVREWAALLCMFLIISPAKGVFLFYFILGFLIPKEKFKTNKTYLFFLTSVILVSFISWLGYNLYTYNVLDSINETANYNNTETSVVTVGLSGFWKVICTFARNIGKTVLARGLYIDRSICQIKFDIGSLASCLAYFAFFVTSFFNDTDEDIKITKRDKIIISSSYILSYVLMSFVGYIAMKMTKQSDIIELKSVYCYQFLPLVGLLMRSNIRPLLKIEKYHIYVAGMITLIQSATFLNVAFAANLL